MDDDLDLRVQELLGAFRLDVPPADRRTAVATAVRRRRWRRRVASGAAAAAVVGVALAGSMARSGHDTVTAGPRAPSAERVIDVAGLPDPIRISEGSGPVAGTESFGAVSLDGGAVTGATQTTLETGAAVVVLAVTPGHATRSLEVSGDGLVEPRQVVIDGPSLLVVRLSERRPHLVLTVVAIDAAGGVRDRARITPFVQDPLDCNTEAQAVGPTEPGAPTYVRHLDAYLAAPLLPACGG